MKFELKESHFVAHNACDCRLCNGQAIDWSHPIFKGEALGSFITGGREPQLIIYSKKMVRITEESAPGNINAPLRPGEEIIASYDHSVHGCWKVMKRQRVHVIKLATLLLLLLLAAPAIAQHPAPEKAEQVPGIEYRRPSPTPPCGCHPNFKTSTEQRERPVRAPQPGGTPWRYKKDWDHIPAAESLTPSNPNT